MKQATPEQIVMFLMGVRATDIVKRLEASKAGSPILCREAAYYIRILRAGLATAADRLDERGLSLEAEEARRLLGHDDDD